MNQKPNNPTTTTPVESILDHRGMNVFNEAGIFGRSEGVREGVDRSPEVQMKAMIVATREVDASLDQSNGSAKAFHTAGELDESKAKDIYRRLSDLLELNY